MTKKDEYQLHSIETVKQARLPLSEQVYMILKQAILTGSLQPDVKLNEMSIAEELNVSATPVREAFRKLARDKLVTTQPWKGVRVKGYTPEEIVSMYQCREMMEGLAARLCAKVATKEQCEELRTISEEGIHTSDPEKRVQINSHLHLLITLFSGNERINDYLTDFREMISRDMYISTLDKSRTELCDAEHRAIVEAISTGDADGAERAMRRHIQNAFVFKAAHAEIAKKQKIEQPE